MAAKKGTTSGSTKAKSGGSSKSSSASKKTSAKSGRGGASAGRAAFLAPVQPDQALAAIVGDKPIPRTELTKRIWDYIKKNGLQDSKDRRSINADDKLRPVLGGKSRVTMFELTKLVSQHVK
ncbi:MAG: hypothetical protein QOD06_1561 [Candidatus Binatota bacterium]|jgi:chromatin remodeling complex protein RSC6|nr:hypothetical protein [Candidatus Binatota bacterium]